MRAVVGTAGGGLIAGLIGGVGGRLAMRVIAAATPSVAGKTTESGALIGQVTRDGTIDVIRVGLFAGIVGAFAYLAVRRALPRQAGWRALAFGIIMVVLAILPTVGGNREDFHLVPIGLFIVCFGLVFLVYGAVTSAVVDILAGSPGPPFARTPKLAVLAVCLLFLFGDVLMVASVI